MQCHAQGMYPVAYVLHNHHFLSVAATFGGNSEQALMAAHHIVMNQERQLMREPGYGTLQHYIICKRRLRTKINENTPARFIFEPGCCCRENVDKLLVHDNLGTERLRARSCNEPLGKHSVDLA